MEKKKDKYEIRESWKLGGTGRSTSLSLYSVYKAERMEAVIHAISKLGNSWANSPTIKVTIEKSVYNDYEFMNH